MDRTWFQRTQNNDFTTKPRKNEKLIVQNVYIFMFITYKNV